MKMTAALTSYFFAKDLSDRSRTWYDQKLTAFIDWCATHSCEMHPTPITDIEELSTNHASEFLRSLSTTPSHAVNHADRPAGSQTVHGYGRAIRAWLRWCVMEDLVAERVVKRLAIPKKEQQVINVFTPSQIQDLLTACTQRYERRYVWLAERDRTMITILLDTGIRASELTGLTLERVHLAQEDSFLLVDGKGKKQREVPLGRKARQQLHRYIHRFRPQTGDSHVFLTRDGRGLHPDGLSAVLYELKQRAGITGVRCSPHDFRHTFAFLYLQGGGDIMRLSRMMGHTDLAVTQGYLRAFSSRDARQGYISVADELLRQKGR